LAVDENIDLKIPPTAEAANWQGRKWFWWKKNKNGVIQITARSNDGKKSYAAWAQIYGADNEASFAVVFKTFESIQIK